MTTPSAAVTRELDTLRRQRDALLDVAKDAEGALRAARPYVERARAVETARRVGSSLFSLRDVIAMVENG